MKTCFFLKGVISKYFATFNTLKLIFFFLRKEPNGMPLELKTGSPFLSPPHP